MGDVSVTGEWVTDGDVLVLNGLLGLDSAVTLEAMQPT